MRVKTPQERFYGLQYVTYELPKLIKWYKYWTELLANLTKNQTSAWTFLSLLAK